MLPSWFRQTVTRLRPVTKTSRGSTVPDWDAAASLVISGCSVQPSTTSLSQDGRVLGIDESFTLYMPPTADVIEGDRVVFNGETYTVIGVPKRWISPTGGLSNKQVSIERWNG